VRELADYAPTTAVTGHGTPMRGERLQQELRRLALNFDQRARPAHGRYRDRPAVTDERGVVELPPAVVSGRTVAFTGIAVGAAVGLAVAFGRRGTRARSAGRSLPDDVAIGSELAAADGGYDTTTTDSPDAR
jgi:hypothetical protein